jgi:hypothetical protein
MEMKVWLVLSACDIVICWSFVNSVLMLLKPDRSKYLLWWPQFRAIPATAATVVLAQKKIRLLGFVFALGSGAFLFVVLVPATLGLILLNLKH